MANKSTYRGTCQACYVKFCLTQSGRLVDHGDGDGDDKCSGSGVLALELNRELVDDKRQRWLTYADNCRASAAKIRRLIESGPGFEGELSSLRYPLKRDGKFKNVERAEYIRANGFRATVEHELDAALWLDRYAASAEGLAEGARIRAEETFGRELEPINPPKIKTKETAQ